MSCVDNRNGSVDVSFIPTEPGKFRKTEIITNTFLYLIVNLLSIFVIKGEYELFVKFAEKVSLMKLFDNWNN